MKVLITGGAGFIGSRIAKKINNKYPNWELTITDKFNNRELRTNGNYKYFGTYKNLKNIDAKIISGDLHDLDWLKLFLSENHFDIIYHQGAISDTTELNEELVMRTNYTSFRIIVEHVIKQKIKLIYASSAATYGNSATPQSLNNKYFPENIYGYSKLQMDKLTLSLKKSNDYSIVGLRYFNVYGPGEIYKQTTSSMILQLAYQAIHYKKVRLFEFGEQNRDFIYIDDVIQANLNAMSYNGNGVFNVGSGISRSFNDIVEILSENLGTNIKIEYFENPHLFYQNNTCADINSTKENLNFNPNYGLETGIADYIKTIKCYTKIDWSYFKKNKDE